MVTTENILQFIMERVRERCEQFDTQWLFLEVCKRKCEQTKNSSEIARRPPYGDVFVAGQLNRLNTVQIQQYFGATNSWEIVKTIDDSYLAFIHNVNNHMCVIMTCGPNTLEVKVCEMILRAIA